MGVRELPDGVLVHELRTHADERGDLTEIHRAEWPGEVLPRQWNLLHDRAGVLRGVHLHHHHLDYLVAVSGKLVLGVQDVRPWSPTHGLAATVDLGGDDGPGAAVIPRGVAHGFYFPVDSIHVYGMSEYWDMDDEWGCRWDDPDLRIEWPEEPRILSPRDEGAPKLASFLDDYLSRIRPS